MNRRSFLVNSAAALGTSALSAVASPNDTIRIATVGLRSRGKSHMQAFTSLPKVDLVALCDVDDAVLRQASAFVESKRGKAPATYTDLRKLLEDKSIDAISIATPNHWHTMQAIWAMQAGKDVYVEKPCSHNMFEAKQIVAAARKYNRIVQQGSQSRSDHGAAGSRAEDARRRDRRRLSWRAACATSGATPSAASAGGAGAGRRGLRSLAGSRAQTRLHRRIASTTTGTGSGITATAIWAIRASTKWISRAGAWA